MHHVVLQNLVRFQHAITVRPERSPQHLGLHVCAHSDRTDYSTYLIPCKSHPLLPNLCTYTSGVDTHSWSYLPSFKVLCKELREKGMKGTFVLVLAGIELIFFRVARMGLCFGFVLKTVLITQGCFHYHWAVLTPNQGFFRFLHYPTSK